MPSSTPAGALARHERRPPLLSRRQPLGIFPTWSFWLDPEVIRLSTPFRLTIGLAVTGLFAVTALVAPALLAGPWWVYGGLASLMVLLSVGGLERYIRRRVRQRALPPG
ncbi:MAG: hypothetical protein R3A51_06090 [Nannocystaceae bacterium]|nr:hypothetical protein [Myxococcales bacterium]